jgi:hypothetical protein
VPGSALGAWFARSVDQELVHPLPGDGVKRAERLVHEQERRPARQRPGRCRAVLHPAGQLMRERLAEPGQADAVQQRLGFGR